MVSLGDTPISLHILQPPLIWGVCSGKSKPKVPRSVQISNFFLGGVLESQNPECQDLPKFQLGGGVF